jgi:hypothetical protein
MLKYFFICFLLIMSLDGLYAQTSGPDFNSKVVPVSPTMATLNRFSDYPVDYSTGVPQISLPVYTINTGGFSFPININFHASGRRAGLDFSAMGVGWAINATGNISREIRERPDGPANRGLETTVSAITNGTGQYPTYYTLRPADMLIPNPPPVSGTFNQDAEHDIYSYNVNGLSGKFIFNAAGTIVQLTYSDSKITSGGTDGPFTITDKNGVQYNFLLSPSSTESVQSYNFLGQSVYTNTGWYLSNITLPSGEVITFTYGTKNTEISTSDGIIGRYISSTVLSYGDQPSGPNGTAPMPPSAQGPHQVSNTAIRTYNISYLQSITFTNGKLNFNYDDSSLKLNSVDILDSKNSLLRSVQFNYIQTPGTLSSFPNNNSISLSTMFKHDASNNTNDTYSFDYYNNQLNNSNNYTVFVKKTDWWGYSNNDGDKFPYNSASSDGTADVESYGCTGCKAPLFGNKISGMLKTITYPTGGHTEFDYEPNLDAFNNEGPGIRIKTIISDDGTGINQLIKSYQYGPGYLPYSPDPMDFRSDTYVFADNRSDGSQPTGGSQSFQYYGYYRQRSYTTTPISTLSEAYQQPIYYNQVTEFQQNSNGINLGKTVYSYTVPQYIQGNLPKLFTPIYYTNSKLIEKAIYKYRSVQNDYFRLKDEQTSYQTLNAATIPQIRMRRNYSVPNDDNATSSSRYLEENFLVPRTLQVPAAAIYDICDNPIKSGVEIPVSKTSFTYDESGNSLKEQTNYYYTNLVHLQPTKIETNTSLDSLINIYTYPDDFTTPSVPGIIWNGIANLKTKHILSPVEVSTYKISLSGTNKRLIISHFYAYNAVKAVADSIFSIDQGIPLTNFSPATTGSGTFVKDSRYVKRYTFDKYDSKLNLVQKHVVNGANTSYLWDYNGTYPIAEVKNADSTSIAYTSFEADGTGNWSVTSSIRSNTGFTGHQSYNLSNGYMSKASLSTSQTYVVTYWTQNTTPYTIANTIAGYPVKKASINGWTCYEHHVTGIANIAITGNGNIDEVRLFPLGAEISTYTYDPLVGMTSSSDAKGETSYYEYDSFQRLRNVKDKDGNILKNYCYNYAGQQTGCPVPQQPVASPYVVMNQVSSVVDANGHTQNTYTFNVYADANLTIPYTVPANLTVNYKITTIVTHSSGSPAPATTTSNQTIVIPAGASQATTAQIDVYHCTGGTPPAVVQQSAAVQTSSAVASPNVVQPGDTICTSAGLMLLSGTGYQIGGLAE